MKNEYLIKHLASVDLSFLKVVKDEVIEVKTKIDVVEILTKIKPIEQPENWNTEIEILEDFFKELTTDNQPIQLNASSRIIDLSIFVKNHLAIVKTNNGNKRFLPYLNRLQKLKIVLTLSKVD